MIDKTAKLVPREETVPDKGMNGLMPQLTGEAMINAANTRDARRKADKENVAAVVKRLSGSKPIATA